MLRLRIAVQVAASRKRFTKYTIVFSGPGGALLVGEALPGRLGDSHGLHVAHERNGDDGPDER